MGGMKKRLTTREAASLLGINLDQVRSLMWGAGVPCRRNGRRGHFLWSSREVLILGRALEELKAGKYQAKPDKNWFTPVEAALELDVTRDLVIGLIENRKLRAYDINHGLGHKKLWRIEKKDLDKFIKDEQEKG